MKTYLVTTKVVVYKTWEVEAENREIAEERYTEGDVYHVAVEGREIYEVVEIENFKKVTKTIFSKPVEVGLELYHQSLRKCNIIK